MIAQRKQPFDNTLLKARPQSSNQIPPIKSPTLTRKSIGSQHQPQRKLPEVYQTNTPAFRVRSITPNNSTSLKMIESSPIKTSPQKMAAQSDKKLQIIVKRPQRPLPYKGAIKNQQNVNKPLNLSESKSPIKQTSKNNFRDTHFKTKQPKCAFDFSMTSKKNELPKLLEQYQKEFKEIIQQQPPQLNVCLNMSEIKEINEDALSSLAQSQL